MSARARARFLYGSLEFNYQDLWFLRSHRTKRPIDSSTHYNRITLWCRIYPTPYDVLDLHKGWSVCVAFATVTGTNLSRRLCCCRWFAVSTRENSYARCIKRTRERATAPRHATRSVHSAVVSHDANWIWCARACVWNIVSRRFAPGLEWAGVAALSRSGVELLCF